MTKKIKPPKTEEEILRNRLNFIEVVKFKRKVKKAFPEFREQFLGKYFKSDNSYGANKTWKVYTKVTELTEKDLYEGADTMLAHFRGFSFQTDHYGDIRITPKVSSYCHSLGKEITEKEFITAWNKMTDSINKIER